MRKFFELSFSVFLLYAILISESKAQFSVGLRAGLNASKITGYGTAIYSISPGFHIGPYVRLALNKKIRLQTDVLFSTKGYVYKLAVTDINGNFAFNERLYKTPLYLDIPVMLNYKTIGGFYVEGGVQPSFVLTQLNFSKPTTNLNSKDKLLKTFDFAPIVGLGYEFKKVSLGIRGSMGVVNLYKDPTKPSIYIQTGSTFKYNQKNLCLMATFGFKF